MYVICLDTTPTWTRYHQLRQSRQLMMQQNHHQHGYKIHQLRQCRQLMMQQKHHQPCMHEYMTQHQYIYSTAHSPTLDIISYITFILHTCIHQ
jgi:chromosome segregation and condensation protein ScpB